MEFPRVRELKPYRTVPEMTKEAGEKYGDLIALQMRKKDGEWQKVSYSTLLDRVSKAASFYRSLGLEPGDRISVIGPNSPEWGIAQLGIMWLGGVAVPLDPRLTVHELRRILQHAEVKAVVADTSYLDDLMEIKDDLSELRHLIALREVEGYELPQLAQGIEGSHPIEPHDVQLDELALIIYTSGTTGLAKGVMLSHRNFAAQVSSMYSAFDYGPGDIFFSVLPLHHVFEFTTGFLAPLDAGATIVYARSLKSRYLKEDLRDVRPTIMLVVPLLMEKIVEGINREVSKSGRLKRNLFAAMKRAAKMGGRNVAREIFRPVRAQLGLERLKYLISGGAAMPRWLSKELELLGFPILQGYGLSEAAPVVSVNPPSKPRNESVGLPLPGVSVKIVEPNIEGIGEIAVRGDNVMLGYYKNPTATERTIVNGWLMTGDMGRMDGDGYLYVVGRKKAVIVTKGGKNIYPEEVEAVIETSPLVAEVLVVMGRNPLTGNEELQAIVYPNFENLDQHMKDKGLDPTSEKDVQKVIEDEVMERVKLLADYKRPRRVVIRYEEFPKTTTRKIKRYLFEQAGGQNI